jgi:hypothetical protein
MSIVSCHLFVFWYKEYSSDVVYFVVYFLGKLPNSVINGKNEMKRQMSAMESLARFELALCPNNFLGNRSRYCFLVTDIF